MADGYILKSSYVGNIRVYSLVNGMRRQLLLKDVYLAPELGSNLLSFDRITGAGCSILAAGNTAKIINKLGDVIGVANKRNKLYFFDSYMARTVSCANANVSESVTGTKLAEKWHRMLGHVNYADLRVLANKQLLVGIPQTIGKAPAACDVCLESKFSNLPHSTTRTRATSVLEIVHSDVNFVSPKGVNGEIGFVSFVDDFSRLVRIYCIKSKIEVPDKLMHFVNTMSNLTDCKVKKLRCDRGTEYLNKRVHEFCSTRGITILPSPANVHELNGTAERYNRTVMNRARCLLKDAGIAKSFWPECVKTATYLGNRLLANTREQKTPFELVFGRKPNVSNLKLFGCRVFIRIPENRRKFKVDPKAEEGILVGYSDTGYRVLVGRSVKETPYVRLAEQHPRREQNSENNLEEEQIVSEEEQNPEVRLFSNYESSDEEHEASPNAVSTDPIVEIRQNEEEPTPQDDHEDIGEAHQENPHDDTQHLENEEIETNSDADNDQSRQEDGRPNRNRKMPSRYNDYVIAAKMCTIAYAPQTFKEAVNGPDSVKWKLSMDEEMENMKTNDVWELVNPPINCKVVPLKWVYRVKSSGKFKSRVVAVGFRQPFKENEETYSPVATIATLRVILSLSCHNGFVVHQMDVEGAFLNGEVRGEVYVGQPKGYDTGDGKVFKLRKALYGLRESPRAWYDCFHSFMIESGFQVSDYDSCLYVKFVNGVLLGLILYVDDLLVFSQNEALVLETKNSLRGRFRMTDLGPIKNYLGISVEYDVGLRTMKLSQSNYIQSLANKYQVADMRTCKTPMEKNLNLPCTMQCDDYVSDYRKLIGALLFVGTGTRPDVLFAVNYLSRFQKCATKVHFRYALRVLKYLQETKDLRLCFHGKTNRVIETYADADWAADSSDRKSTGGILIRVFGNPVVWSCRKQSSVTRASTYAEYVALADAVSELLPVLGVLGSLKVAPSGPALVFEDNSGAVVLAQKGKFTKRAKHIEVAYHFVADYVAKGIIRVVKIDSKNQLADILTKALGCEKFTQLRAALSIK